MPPSFVSSTWSAQLSHRDLSILSITSPLIIYSAFDSSLHLVISYALTLLSAEPMLITPLISRELDRSGIEERARS